MQMHYTFRLSISSINKYWSKWDVKHSAVTRQLIIQLHWNNHVYVNNQNPFRPTNFTSLTGITPFSNWLECAVASITHQTNQPLSSFLGGLSLFLSPGLSLGDLSSLLASLLPSFWSSFFTDFLSPSLSPSFLSPSRQERQHTSKDPLKHRNGSHPSHQNSLKHTKWMAQLCLIVRAQRICTVRAKTDQKDNNIKKAQGKHKKQSVAAWS